MKITLPLSSFCCVFLFFSCQKSIADYPTATKQPDTTKPTDTLYTYIIAGQSNAGGRVGSGFYTGNYGGLIGAGRFKAFTKNYGQNNSFEQLQTGVNCSDDLNAAGIQPILGYELTNYKRRDIYFLQSISNGIVILNWDVDRAMGKWLDTSIVNFTTSALTDHKKVVFKGFIWIQGESNGGDSLGYYKGKLETLLARVRLKTGNPTLPAIIVQMSDCQTGVKNLALLQEAQATVAAKSNNYLISKSIGNNCKDALHFNYTGQHNKAIAIFNLVKDF